MNEIAKATKSYPKFADGRIDYTNERVCYVLNCVVVSGDKVLLTKRSATVGTYPNTINGISGFIDDTSKTLDEVAKQELIEELNAPLEKMQRMVVGEPFVQIDEAIDREWHVYSILAEFSSEFAPTTNWENKSAGWFAIKDVPHMELMYGFLKTFQTAIALRGE